MQAIFILILGYLAVFFFVVVGLSPPQVCSTKTIRLGYQSNDNIMKFYIEKF